MDYESYTIIFQMSLFLNIMFIINIISFVTIPITVFLQNFNYWITAKFVCWIPAAEFMFLITTGAEEEAQPHFQAVGQDHDVS